MISPVLYFKAKIVGTPFEIPAQKLRWFLGARERLKHPELWELYLEERRLPLVLQRVLSRDSCGIDVGCHIGSFLSLLKRSAPDGRHVAFEPSATKAKLLKRHFPTTEIHTLAISDVNGRAFFQENYSQPGYSQLQGEKKSMAAGVISYEVEVRRLDDMLIGKDRIDLIKLDIEGTELAALRGACRVIKQFRPVLIFECGSEYGMAEKTSSRRELYDCLTDDLGYVILTFSDFLFDKGSMTFDEFRKCGLYPFRAFNFVALPQ